jgi:NAD-dependent SIR2 family protein deacetylase
MPAAAVYLDLFNLVKDKPYFIITTNVDGQFFKAGFNRDYLFHPQGDYALFQCRRPCSDRLYDNREMIQKMLANMDDAKFQIREDDIPRCPLCGDYLERNLRIDETFVEAPHLVMRPAYEEFVNRSVSGNLLVLELGVGFNTPGIIRWPFEEITLGHRQATLVRINRDHPEVPSELIGKSVSLDQDISQVLKNLLKLTAPNS